MFDVIALSFVQAQGNEQDFSELSISLQQQLITVFPRASNKYFSTIGLVPIYPHDCPWNSQKLTWIIFSHFYPVRSYRIFNRTECDIYLNKDGIHEVLHFESMVACDQYEASSKLEQLYQK